MKKLMILLLAPALAYGALTNIVVKPNANPDSFGNWATKINAAIGQVNTNSALIGGNSLAKNPATSNQDMDGYAIFDATTLAGTDLGGVTGFIDYIATGGESVTNIAAEVLELQINAIASNTWVAVSNAALSAYDAVQNFSYDPLILQTQITANAASIDGIFNYNTNVFSVAATGTALENGTNLLAKVAELNTYFGTYAITPTLYIPDGEYDLNGSELLITNNMVISALNHKPLKVFYDLPLKRTSIVCYDYPSVQITGNVVFTNTAAPISTATGLYIIGDFNSYSSLGLSDAWLTSRVWLINSRVTGNVAENNTKSTLSMSGCFVEGRFAGGTATWAGHVYSSAIIGANSFQGTFGTTTSAETRLIQDSHVMGTNSFVSSNVNSGGYRFVRSVINGKDFAGSSSGHALHAEYTHFFNTVTNDWPAFRDLADSAVFRWCDGVDTNAATGTTYTRIHYCTDTTGAPIVNLH